MDVSDLELNKRFSRSGEGVWRIQSCYFQPSCIMVNDESGETSEFGMGGTMAESFQEIEE